MGAAQMREELYQYIKAGDAHLLELLYTVAKQYEVDYTLPGPPMTIEEFQSRIHDARAKVAVGHFTTQADLEKEMEGW